MPRLIFNNTDEYIVSHAVKGPNYIHGFDERGTMIVAFEAISDFSLYTYTDKFLAPDECFEEPLNRVSYVNNKLVMADGTGVPIWRKETISLTSGGWKDKKQEVSCSLADTDNLVIVSPASSSIVRYGECGVFCIAQSKGKLTFQCSVVPTETMTVDVAAFI